MTFFHKSSPKRNALLYKPVVDTSAWVIDLENCRTSCADDKPFE